MRFGLCIPLLAIGCALSTSGTALVTGVTRDTASMSANARFMIELGCLYYPMIAVGEGHYCERKVSEPVYFPSTSCVSGCVERQKAKRRIDCGG